MCAVHLCVEYYLFVKLKEDISGEVETLQDHKAITVNVKENSQYITVSCREFYLTLFISRFVWKEPDARWTRNFSSLLLGRQFRAFIGHETRSYKACNSSPRSLHLPAEIPGAMLFGTMNKNEKAWTKG